MFLIHNDQNASHDDIMGCNGDVRLLEHVEKYSMTVNFLFLRLERDPTGGCRGDRGDHGDRVRLLCQRHRGCGGTVGGAVLFCAETAGGAGVPSDPPGLRP